MSGAWRATVITVSDRAARGAYTDESGPVVAAALREAGYEVGDVVVVEDGDVPVTAALRDAIAAAADLIVTTGGTGFAPRDRTPEATRAVIDREAPGLAEVMRARGRESTPFADLSRGIAGIAGGTVVVNLPGSVNGARESIAAVVDLLDHAVAQARGAHTH